MIEAVQGCIGGMALSERNSLVKLVLNVTNAFDSAFSRWTVGLGIEPHLNALRAAVGLPEKLVGENFEGFWPLGEGRRGFLGPK